MHNSKKSKRGFPINTAILVKIEKASRLNVRTGREKIILEDLLAQISSVVESEDEAEITHTTLDVIDGMASRYDKATQIGYT